MFKISSLCCVGRSSGEGHRVKVTEAKKRLCAWALTFKCLDL